MQIPKELFKSILCSKNDFLKDTIIRRIYSGRKRRATVYVYLNGSTYCYDEGFSQLRSCIHDAIINAAPRIGKKLTNCNCIDSVQLDSEGQIHKRVGKMRMCIISNDQCICIKH